MSVSANDPAPAPPQRSWISAIRRHGPTVVGAFLTAGVGIFGIASTVLAKYEGSISGWMESIPLPALLGGFVLVVMATFIAGSVAAGIGARRDGRAALDVRAVEIQLAQAHRELAVVQDEIANRSSEYVSLGEKLDDAQAILELTQRQAASVIGAVERAVSRTKRVWWLSVLAYALGVATNYFVNWTSGGIKPSWLP